MYILKLKAIGDYNTKYFINISTSNDAQFIIDVKIALNNFCSSLEGVDTCIRMSRYLCEEEIEKKFNDFILPLMEYYRAKQLFDKIKDVCDKNYVYLCSDSFELEDVVSLLR